MHEGGEVSAARRGRDAGVRVHARRPRSQDALRLHRRRLRSRRSAWPRAAARSRWPEWTSRARVFPSTLASPAVFAAHPAARRKHAGSTELLHRRRVGSARQARHARRHQPRHREADRHASRSAARRTWTRPSPPRARAFETYSRTTREERIALLQKIIDVYQAQYEEIAKTISDRDGRADLAVEGRAGGDRSWRTSRRRSRC